ncbi:hypothetical protein [Nocardia sp. CY15]|uniref:hypothetical protein n=1 Tax=Nocardia sp. CY15 TaxID=2608687 RepID=UPI001F0BC0EF|nr:hypothetical protein [Nocardia sp. CY15]
MRDAEAQVVDQSPFPWALRDRVGEPARGPWTCGNQLGQLPCPWREDADRLTPHFWNPGTDDYLAAVQT